MKKISFFFSIYLIFSCKTQSGFDPDKTQCTFLQTLKCGNESLGVFSYEGQFYAGAFYKTTDSLRVNGIKYTNVTYFKTSEKYQELQKYKITIAQDGWSRKDLSCLDVKQVPFAIVSSFEK
jgi:hypothetical protein